ncbi:MAG TPA: glutamyl-tRNA reductase [Candidatus Dormibacteraeota bacterium]|nr:glutamyl-tRNA reductase [Candidatus Dormibacteraeota bacterium]HLR89177.1 glutamyl-tRNA reductase [Atopostipes sp.]
MHILKVGISHQTAPLEMREKLSFSEEAVIQAMLELQKQHVISENVIISTCNRTEIYAVTEHIETGAAAIQEFIANWFQLEGDEFAQFFNCTEDGQAIQHLFKLATGLDSMVIGETQILGQVRQSFLTAQKLQVTGRIFNELFKRVITFAKQAHRDTAIGKQAVSISYVAVELSKKIFGNIEGKHIVILGAGETGELTLRNLQGAGVSNITVINRTLERAEQLANKFVAQAVPFEDLLESLKEADILISSTASTASVLTKEKLQPILEERKEKPLFLIDIAMPRDIDPTVAELEQVFLYNLDDLQNVVDENMEARKEVAHLIEKEVETELNSFYQWLEMLEAVPVIQALQEKSMAIQEAILTSMYQKMPELTDRETKIVQKHIKSVTHQLLKEPMNYVKQVGNKEKALEEVRLIFGLHQKNESN